VRARLRHTGVLLAYTGACPRNLPSAARSGGQRRPRVETRRDSVPSEPAGICSLHLDDRSPRESSRSSPGARNPSPPASRAARSTRRCTRRPASALTALRGEVSCSTPGGGTTNPECVRASRRDRLIAVQHHAVGLGAAAGTPKPPGHMQNENAARGPRCAPGVRPRAAAGDDPLRRRTGDRRSAPAGAHPTRARSPSARCLTPAASSFSRTSRAECRSRSDGIVSDLTAIRRGRRRAACPRASRVMPVILLSTRTRRRPPRGCAAANARSPRGSCSEPMCAASR